MLKIGNRKKKQSDKLQQCTSGSVNNIMAEKHKIEKKDIDFCSIDET